MNIKNFPWKLGPPDEYKDEYAAERMTGNRERMRVVALILIVMFSSLVVQHLLGPGVSRTSPAFAAYLVIYFFFVAGSSIYLLVDRFGTRNTGSTTAQWLLVCRNPLI